MILVLGSGCATQALLSEAKPHNKYNEETREYQEVPGNRGAYAGVPFAVVLDVATAPLVGLWLLIIYASGYRC